MTRRRRQLLVAGALVVLLVWAVLAWFGSSSGTPEPSSGPAPTGAIDSGPLTFRPSDGVASSPSAGESAPD
jgi:hypothetical protein